uniref:Uncharacterized protein n=1 Tax=Arcella intermedia TaxID=1963864 RepID=A0A6B2LMH9_9EUKA
MYQEERRLHEEREKREEERENRMLEERKRMEEELLLQEEFLRAREEEKRKEQQSNEHNSINYVSIPTGYATSVSAYSPMATKGETITLTLEFKVEVQVSDNMSYEELVAIAKNKAGSLKEKKISELSINQRSQQIPLKDYLSFHPYLENNDHIDVHLED